MGAVSIYETAWAKTPREAFNELSEDAREEYGSDYYNGKINNSSLRGEFKPTKDVRPFTKKWDKIIEDFLEGDDNCKGEVYYIEVSKQSAKNKGYARGYESRRRGTKFYVFIGSAPY